MRFPQLLQAVMPIVVALLVPSTEKVIPALGGWSTSRGSKTACDWPSCHAGSQKHRP